MSWVENDPMVARGYGKVRVRGQSYGDFGVRVLACQDHTVSHLIHLRTGFGIGAFRTQGLAQRAGKIADALIGSDFERLSPQKQAHKIRAIYDAWKRGGIVPSYVMDDANNVIWCERDADAGVEFEFWR